MGCEGELNSRVFSYVVCLMCLVAVYEPAALSAEIHASRLATIILQPASHARPPSYSAKRLTEALLRLSNNYVGAQFRRLRTKLGAPLAINAMAAKLPQRQVR
jgi:hypothetical protein